MKLFTRSASTVLLLAALAPSVHAEFLVVSIRESTAENIWRWVAAFSALLVLATLRNSQSKGGEGN
jgi:hypothetical protein